MKPNAEPLQLLPHDEARLRIEKIAAAMRQNKIDAVIVSDNANLFYLTGRVFCGYIVVFSDTTVGTFIKRPVHLESDDITFIRKPEDMAGYLERNLPPHATIGLMGDDTSWSMIERISDICRNFDTVNASKVLRSARAVKTDRELECMKQCGQLQTDVYRHIPALYREGMTDIELQIEIERALRLKGCLGIFRTSGDGLELFMGNVLTGENADSPSPYDFAMGGRGLDPSLPVGADGTLIRMSMPVMVDMNGNFNGYMTDMTRCYICGDIPNIVFRAHSLSCRICNTVAENAVEGRPAADLYHMALDMARQEGLDNYFMGCRQHAGFVGHGIGITVNEPPVLAPRSRDILQSGHTIAVEPKFVIPGHGAIGIENTYIVNKQGPAQCITLCPEEIISLT